MKIHLPNSAFLGNIDSFFKSFDPSNKGKLEITANPNWISIHPVVLAMVAALGLELDPSYITCEKFTARSKHYLERMGLFKFLGVQSDMVIKKHEPAGRFIPLTQINTSEELKKFITEMTPLLHLSPKHAEPIRYIISELVRNVLEHSLSQYGALVAAQYFQKSNTIRIGIADTGVGIWKTINNAYNPKDDLDAIRLALTPGITGTTRKEGGTEQNAGAGLFFIKSIANVNRDFFVIYSGTAMYKLLKRQSSKIKKIKLYADPLRDRHSSEVHLPNWEGTVVGIDISLATTSEFSLLLDLISQTYREAIRERKTARYRKPKFI
ncbi:MAG: sensor histidine kinase [Parcubacteria group bacterium]|nr:sensor histidine kinase [Parcubacteria group bacterium]